MIFRCFNARRAAAKGTVRLPFPIGGAARVRADEGPGAELPVEKDGRTVRFVAAAREIVTLLLRPGGPK